MAVAKMISGGTNADVMLKAIESGFLSVEAARAYKSIAEENEVLKGEISSLKAQLKKADEIMAHDRSMIVEALSKCLSE